MKNKFSHLTVNYRKKLELISRKLEYMLTVEEQQQSICLVISLFLDCDRILIDNHH